MATDRGVGRRTLSFRIGRRRYRWVGWGRRRKSHATTDGVRIIVIVPVCPRCQRQHLDGDGDTRIGWRVTRKPMICRLCGCPVEVAWPTSPALRDVYCAERAGVSVQTFRRYRDMALDIYRDDDRHGA